MDGFDKADGSVEQPVKISKKLVLIALKSIKLAEHCYK